jgi:beta-lactamase class A
MILSYEITRVGQLELAVRRIHLAFALIALPALAALPRPDASLQARLEATAKGLGLEPLVSDHKLAVSLIDLSDPGMEHYAAINDRQMMYAASLPKLAILLGAFQATSEGLLQMTPGNDASLTRMIRQSSNTDASFWIQRLGYGFIAQTLASEPYRLYDSETEGGLWLGKAYGPSGLRHHVEFWRPEPISGEWHAANSLQVARFFWLLEQGSLVGTRQSAAMKRILKQADGSEYFATGLRQAGVREIYRKSGTYLDTHCDAVLVNHDGRHYIAVAMVNDYDGPNILVRLIRELHHMLS